MADTDTGALSAEEESTLAALQSRKAAAEQAAKNAEGEAVRAFVGSAEFKAFQPAAMAAHKAATLDPRISNIVICMDQLATMFPG